MKQFYSKITLVSIVFLLFFTACKPDPEQPNISEIVKNDYLLSETYSLPLTSNEVEEHVGLLGQMFFYLTSNDTITSTIQIDGITYKTLDPNGNEIIASGTVTYPIGADIRGILVAQHHTITSNDETPSEVKVSIENLLSFNGYAIVQADYIGYGVSVNSIHPYIHAENTATVCIDMLFAAKEHLNNKNIEFESDEVIVAGYSQGGHAALAFQKEVEHNLENKIAIKEVIAGAGPYDLAATLQQVLESDSIATPAFLPLIVLGLNYGDQLNINLNEVFKEPLLSSYESWYYSKNYTVEEINTFLNNTQTLSDFVYPEAFDLSTPTGEALTYSFTNNSLINWTPKAKITFLHSTEDQDVPYFNSQTAYDNFKSKGCNVELIPFDGSHTEAAVDYYVHLINHLK